MNRRELVTAGIALLGAMRSAEMIEAATPEDDSDAPWLSGRSAIAHIPTDAVAAPGTVQLVRVSPVLYPEFAAILIHNATDRAVMLDTVRGMLRAPNLAGFEREQSAYGIPAAILPPGEYWIGRLMTPVELAVGTAITFDAEVSLLTKPPRQSNVVTLLTAVAPEREFTLPEPGENWPIRYENDSTLTTARLVSYQQIFFDDVGEICGFISADDKSNPRGEAQFRMELTHQPGASTGGAVLGESSNRWLAQWSHAPGWDAFAGFDFDE